MRSYRNLSRSAALLLRAFAFFLILNTAAGCKKHSAHTSDSRLLKIDEMLDKQLPVGATRGRVVYFLNSRGYKIVSAPDKTLVVAIVRQVDTDTLQPATARASFHFDSNEKLTSYDLQPGPETPLQP